MASQKKHTDMGHPEMDSLWQYTHLTEPHLSNELERLAFAKSTPDTDLVTFQPCPNPDESNQDRVVVENWLLPGGTWSFRAVFDGHAGDETAVYTAQLLPDLIKAALESALATEPLPDSSAISALLAETISSFDRNIGQPILDLFPDPVALDKLSDDDIKRIINDDGPIADAVSRCMRGTTVLVALVDPSKSNIWVASLGDCAAVLGTKSDNGTWQARVLSAAHNGDNSVEADRVRKEHPGEEEVMLDNRVLGAIAVTRAVGDFSFKFPAVYTNRIFLNSARGFQVSTKVQAFTARNFTPPYLSSAPDVQHIDLKILGSSQQFLILCSDGLMDLYEDDRLHLDQVLSERWANVVGDNLNKPDANLAILLLRDGLGGSDETKVSRMITVEMTFRWMDDTSIIVQKLMT